jgi:fucose permease
LTKSNTSFLYIAIIITFFVWGAVAVISGLLMPETTEAFSINGTQSGLMFIIWSTGFTLGSFGAKPLLSKFQFEKLLGIVACGSALFAFCLYLSESYIQYLVSFMLLGVTGGASFTTAHTFVGQTFVHNRASALSALDVVFSMGSMISPLLLVVMFSFAFAWQTPFLLAAITFLLCAIAYLSIRRKGVEGAQDTDQDTSEIQKTSHILLPIAVLAVPTFFMGALEWAHNLWFVSFAIEQGVGEDTARIYHSVFLGGMIAIRIITIVIGNCIHNIKLIRVLLAFTLVGNIGIVVADSWSLFIIASFMMGVGLGAMFPILLARAMDVNPQRSASFSVAMVLFITAGGHLSSLAIGALADIYSIADTFMFSTVFAVLLFISFEYFCTRTGKILSNQEQ